MARLRRYRAGAGRNVFKKTGSRRRFHKGAVSRRWVRRNSRHNRGRG